MSRPTIVVGVAWSTPETQDLVQVELPAGATVADAVRAAALVGGVGVAPAGASIAVFGKRVGRDAPLADGDRVEICRALHLDPDEARRLRAVKRGRGGNPPGNPDLPADGN
jgi:putative ubiquitin-RnfH superfamily antitoxin RatB of RatAB toxin-antitoxin module